MKIIKFRPFWSYDVLKTEQWLKAMNHKGYGLTKVSFKTRLFHFKRINPDNTNYLIVYDKGSNGIPKRIKQEAGYEAVCYQKNYYVIKTTNEKTDYMPSYDQLLEKNQFIKYVTGIILLIEVMLFSLPVLAVITSIMTGSFTIETGSNANIGPTSVVDFLLGVASIVFFIGSILTQVWLIYTFFKLNIANKKLNKLCGETIELSFTIPTNTILNKAHLRELKSKNLIIKKTRIGWFYSPDKFETWIEGMADKGCILLRMSKIGNSFYFLKADPKKMTFHVDFQKKNGPTYYKTNEESGWQLYFTSITRFYSISVWGQTYDDIKPSYYSDNESKLIHAKTFMKSYIIWFLPLGIVYILMFAYAIYKFFSIEFFRQNMWMVVTPVIFLLLGIEFLIFSYWLIKYYYRVKKEQ